MKNAELLYETTTTDDFIQELKYYLKGQNSPNKVSKVNSPVIYIKKGDDNIEHQLKTFAFDDTQNLIHELSKIKGDIYILEVVNYYSAENLVRAKIRLCIDYFDAQ